MTRKTLVPGFAALICAGAGLALVSQGASGEQEDPPPQVSALVSAPIPADAEKRFAKMSEHVDTTTIRSLGVQHGLEWLIARGVEANLCLISADATMRSAGLMCTPPNDDDATHLRVSRDTTAGKHLTAAIVPDGYTAARAVRGRAQPTAPKLNLVVVDQQGDAVIEVTSPSKAPLRIEAIDVAARVQARVEAESTP